MAHHMHVLVDHSSGLLGLGLTEPVSRLARIAGRMTNDNGGKGSRSKGGVNQWDVLQSNNTMTPSTNARSPL
jgi:hypothetical protein